ncbi:hypothetical protein [[Clostridium] polysaccharolyticum]|uniref:Uncharacterized protein n=1 Tax=[Clostridium] polysaccharolyticum TaxID=29364 RepID=A0A1I0CRM2_9FIRM|nr:hypothetical protein [[Clostridium] polysaccharolyticum]SET21948.1 hypothetical protein SAMN04487772_1118 [[Clostridium] polysaccharolyticum]
MKLTRVQLKRNKNQIIMANGSERSDYIPMKYIFSQFERIHDGVQLMKTYYPNEKNWSDSHRISEVTKKENVDYAWGYEYEDYHPFNIWSEHSSTLREIEEIKQYGADLHLTLTMDLALSEDEIRKIAESLRGYGKIYLRINHEMNGTWFRYNTQHTYKEACDFFVKCHHIIKQVSSNIYTVFNLSADAFVVDVQVRNEPLHLDALREALQVADYWSIDKYASLNWGWPFEMPDDGEHWRHWTGTVENWWTIIEETYIKMIWNNDLKAKPLFINEFNSDSDVDGENGQAEVISKVYKRIARGEFEWLEGIVLYQFRDYGGLGLEKGTREKFCKLPALSAYKEAIQEFPYSFQQEKDNWENADFTFVWQDIDQVYGVRIKEIQGKDCFQNKLDMPVFLTWENGTVWKRILPEESVSLPHKEEVYLFVPPYKNKNHVFQYSAVVRNIESQLEKMFQ